MACNQEVTFGISAAATAGHLTTELARALWILQVQCVIRQSAAILRCPLLYLYRMELAVWYGHMVTFWFLYSRSGSAHCTIEIGQVWIYADYVPN